MKSVHFLNGQFVNEDDLLISPRDLGYSRGYAVFDFMIASKGRPFMLERHIDRLYRSCRSISLSLPWSKEQISDWVLQTLEANKTVENELVIRISISGGSSETLTPAKTPTIIIMIDPRIGSYPEDYANGVHVLLSEFEKYEPQAKTNNYIEAIRQFNSIPNDIHEIIYHSRGMVREGTRCNVFAVINGSLLTPKTGILGGVTRSVILNDLQPSVPAKVRDFSVQELLSASEIFITATSKEVMPVTKLNNVPVGGGSVGPVTKEVMNKFRSFFESDLW
jgi:branched-subunit amino acid aminotransferase/4-amino-4-deoxychorismate lyase